MQFLGKITRLQIQRSPMKIMQDGIRTYHTKPLQPVSKLKVTTRGIYGLLSDGTTIIDTHHRNHPQSRNRSDNDISIGFTSHYQLMRHRFGEWIEYGFAGENILINVTERIYPRELGQHIIIQSAKTGQQYELGEITPAPPCVEFSLYLAQRNMTAEEVKFSLQYLDNGLRGYYVKLIKPTPFEVSIDDTIYLP